MDFVVRYWSKDKNEVVSSISESTAFPKKICAVCWLQNIEVASRAQDIVNHLQEYVKVATREKIKNQCLPVTI
ncbi:hypothetical protein PR048_006745 [Dryococelus australis]|uniref:Uncharacterized protein n=1 Tax=Dryococelus australis TaxID=614101 RepID=A0ABQ9IBS9_9NEOP|nr:hypothetical protein PR048_006745 [Dryococelus australis]